MWRVVRERWREVFEGFWDGFAEFLMVVMVAFAVVVIVADRVVQSAAW
jgi:hypothetical protein